MKTIPLTQRPPEDNSPFPGTVGDAAVIKQIISVADPQTGMGLDEMRRGIKILDAIDAAVAKGDTGALVLEDAQWEFLCAKVRAFRWGVADLRFVELADSILNA